MNIVGAIIALGGLVTFITEVVKRVPIKLTSKNPRIWAAIVALVLIGASGYINGDTYEVVAQQVVIAVPVSYVVYDIVRWAYGRVRQITGK